MTEHEYPIDVTCPATGEPCELLVRFSDQYTANHKEPRVSDVKIRDDVATLNRILMGYTVLRTCQKLEDTVAPS